MSTRFKMLASLLFSVVLAASVTTTALAQEDLSSQDVSAPIELGSPEDDSQDSNIQELQIVTDDLDTDLGDEIVVVQDDSEPSVNVQDGETAAKSVADNPVTQGANLTKATQKYGLQNAVVLEATTVDEIDEAVSIARKRTTAQTPYVIHVPAGKYEVYRITLPVNVFMVAEDGASFVYASSENVHSMFTVSGAIYGGSYDGVHTVKNILDFGNHDFAQVGGFNGTIDSATVKRAKYNGILANDPTCQNSIIRNCVVTDCIQNGISVERDSSIKLISGCTTSNNGVTGKLFSGINLSHSNIGRIENCIINNNTDKAISTNSDPIAGATQPGCTIGTVTGCTMRGNKAHGVFLKPKCYIKEFTNNVLENNKDGLMCNGKTADGTKGTSWAKKVSGNKFKNNTNSNIDAHWAGALIEVGNNNTLIGSKSNSLIAFDGGEIKLFGKGITISGAKAAGISVSGKGSKITISSSGIVVKNNGSQGIYCNGGTLKLSGTGAKITGNRSCGIYVKAKSTVNISGASTTIKNNKKSGIYVEGSSTVKISGKKLNIQGSGGFGVHVKKSTVTITGASAIIQTSGSSGVGLYNGAKFTMTGKSSQIKKNKAFGIYAKEKSRAKIKNVKYSSNKAGNTYKTGGAKIVK